jgi:predicted DNA-binding transcriptional regulator YafY
VQIIYTGPNGIRTRRLVTPKYVSSYQNQVYLVAFCHLRQAQRTFRLDRILCVD